MRQVLIPELTPETLPFLPPRAWRKHHLRGTAIGTEWTLAAYAPDHVGESDLTLAVEAALRRAEGLFSQWQPQSELSRLNSDPRTEVPLSADFASFLRQVIDLGALTGGRYDPSLGRLTELWGFGASGPQSLPSHHEVAEALAASGARNLTLDLARGVLRRPVGLWLDFSGSAKGWAAEAISSELVALGALSHLVELGGEVVARGQKPDLGPWWVDLEDEDPSLPALRLALCDSSLASSGDWRRRSYAGGVPFSHTLDPATGFPVTSPLCGASVLAPDAATADVLATALLTMEPEEALAFCAAQKIFAVLTERSNGGTRRHLSDLARRASR